MAYYFNGHFETLTIIGNGFDLALGAETTYKSFYNCLKCCFESKDLELFKKEYLNNDNGLLVERFFEIVSKERSNFFINYFLRYEKIFGDWVSFETELTKIIISFDSLLTHLGNPTDYHIDLSNDLYLKTSQDIDLMSVFNVLPNNKFFIVDLKPWYGKTQELYRFSFVGKTPKNRFDVYKSISDFSDSFPKDLYGDLSVFSNLFEIFLFITRVTDSRDVSFRKILKSSCFVNYNYTDYLDAELQKIGNKTARVLYINGKADPSFKRDRQGIVFGIDSSTTIKNKGFGVFTKTVQRSMCDTGVKVLSYTLNESVFSEIFVFGHSLSLADFESLHFIISACQKEDFKSPITIYCYDEKAKIDAIINLRTILGEEMFDNYQREGQLNFVESKGEAIQENKMEEKGQ